MPFDKDTAAVHGSEGGKNRWRGSSHPRRNKPLYLKVSEEEYAEIKAAADNAGLPMVEYVLRAVAQYDRNRD